MHIVGIQPGLKSRKKWEWSAVIHTISASSSSLSCTWKMGRDLVRVAVYQSITMRRRMIRVGALMYGLWLAQISPITVEKLDSRQNKMYLAFQARKQKTGTIWCWPIAGLLVCDLYLVLECTCFWQNHFFSCKNTLLTQRGVGSRPVLTRNPYWRLTRVD